MARKKQYRIRNWPEYNKGLVNRGSLTIWFDENSIAKWHDIKLTGVRGRPCDYSNTAILCALSLRNLFRLPLRATEGLVTSLIELLELPITAPDYSTLSRRQATLDIPTYQSKNSEPVHLVIDSTRIKIYGEGEWKMRQHGKEKRRTWRKLHIAVNEATHDIVMAIITEATVHDSEALNPLLKSINLKVDQATGDGAYDTHDCYKAVIDIGAKPCFPPRINAAKNNPTDQAWRLRNQVVGKVRDKGLKKSKKFIRNSLLKVEENIWRQCFWSSF